MTNRISEAAQGTGEAVGALQELGLSASKLNTLTADEKMVAIAKALAGVENQGDKARLAIDLFGRQGIQLLGTLEGLAESGMKPLQDEMRELGVLSAADAKGIEEMNDSWGEFKAAIQGVFNQVAASLAPVLNDLLEHVLIPMAKALVSIAKAWRLAFGADATRISGAGDEARKSAEAGAAATSKWAEEQKKLKEATKAMAAAQKEASKAAADRLKNAKAELSSLEKIKANVQTVRTPTAGAVAGGTSAGFNAVQRLITEGRDKEVERLAIARMELELSRKRTKALEVIARLEAEARGKETIKVVSHKIVG